MKPVLTDEAKKIYGKLTSEGMFSIELFSELLERAVLERAYRRAADVCMRPVRQKLGHWYGPFDRHMTGQECHGAILALLEEEKR